MSSQLGTHSANDAAEAFYGQSEENFAATIKALGATDPRLIQAFENTRQRFQAQKTN